MLRRSAPVLLEDYSNTTSATPVLLCTTNTTPVLQSALLQSASPEHYSSTTLAHKAPLPALQKYYSAATYYSFSTKYDSRAAPYFSVLLRCCSVLHNHTQLLNAAALLQNATPIFVAVPQSNSSTTLRLQYYFVLQSAIADPQSIAPYYSHMKGHLQCAEQQDVSPDVVWQAQHLVRLEGDACFSAHWK